MLYIIYALFLYLYTIIYVVYAIHTLYMTVNGKFIYIFIMFSQITKVFKNICFVYLSYRFSYTEGDNLLNQ